MEHVDLQNKHPENLGRLLTNMLSLEMLLRLYIFNKEGGTESHKFKLDSFDEGDEVPNNPLTDPNLTLRPLIEKYNSYCKTNSGELCIDPNLADIRNALVHGRVLSLDPTFSTAKLYNFEKEKEGQIRMTFAVSMTKEWFTKQIKLFLRATINVQKMIKNEFPAIIGEIEWR